MTPETCQQQFYRSITKKTKEIKTNSKLKVDIKDWIDIKVDIKVDIIKDIKIAHVAFEINKQGTGRAGLSSGQ